MRGVRTDGRTTGREGYALPAVLAVLAVLTLVFISAMTALKSLGDAARAAIGAADFERVALTAEARTAYLATTEPLAQDRLRVGGLRLPAAGDVDVAPYLASPSTPLRIDGRPYLWSPGASDAAGGGQAPHDDLIALQDEAGLMNLNYSRQDALQRLFIRAGTDNTQAATLADELLDYIDADDDRRIDGAEAPEYAAAGRTPPPNTPMNRMSQVSGVLDWPVIMTPVRWRRVADLVDSDPGAAAFNVNTAPLDVLEVVLNLSPDRARAVIAQREVAPITSIGQIGLAESDSTVTYVLATGRFRLKISDPRRRLSYTSTIVLTPENLTRPFWIDHGAAVRTSLDSPSNSVIDLGAAPRFPDPVGQPPRP